MAMDIYGITIFTAFEGVKLVIRGYEGNRPANVWKAIPEIF